MMKIFSRLAYSLNYIMVLLVFAPISAQAETEQRPLDVVLVMDSSGSMKHTDPHELRKPAAKLFISLLGAQDRASVVSFSDNGYPVAFLTKVKGDKNQQKLFAAVDRISHKGVYTNLHGAIEGALRVFKRDPLPNRKQIVVLMSDGQMDLGNEQKNDQLTQQLRNDLIPQLKQKGIELHTIAFTDQSDKTTLEQLAVTSGGKFNLAQSDKQLHDAYTAIFEQNKQPNMLPFDGEKFSIDSAINEVTIVGSKDSEDIVLSLLSPSGEVYTAKEKSESVKWFTAQAFDLITISQPPPGQWQIKASSGKNKAYIITDLKFQLTVDPQELAIDEGLLINAWLEEQGEILTKDSVLSNLSVQMQVHTPEGETHVLDLDPEADAEDATRLSGTYMSHIALPGEGLYQIEVVAKTNTFSRVRNSSVKVYDPAKMQTEPVQQTPMSEPKIDQPEKEPPTQPDPAPEIAEPVIAPPILPAINEPLVEPGQSTQVQTEQASEAKPHQEDDKTTDEPATSSKESEKNTEKPAKEKDKNNKKSKQADAADKKEDGSPSLVKALLIFLGINGIFALLGGIAYLVYRMKKKKSKANETKDAGEAVEEEKQAA